MIKTIVIPRNNNLVLAIPDSYIGREVEILLFSSDELQKEKTTAPNNAARFKGILTSDEAEKYHHYLTQARSEWDRDI